MGMVFFSIFFSFQEMILLGLGNYWIEPESIGFRVQLKMESLMIGG